MLVVLRVKEFPPFLWGIFISKRACLFLNMTWKSLLGCLFMLYGTVTQAQTLGGSAVYNFLKLPMGGQLSSLGGRQVSHFSADLSLVAENPALLRPQHHAFISASFNNIAATVTALQGIGAYHHKKSKTDFAIGLLHVLYGQEIQTDASGNVLGTFSAFDQLISASFSKNYGTRWRYGASLKLVNSNYGMYRSLGVAADVGLTYYHEESKFQMGFVAKNMGFQLKTFGGNEEDLPFDITVGMTKQLEKAPLRFSITAQRLHQFDLLYNDTLYSNLNFGNTQAQGFLNKVVSHLVVGTELLLGDRLVVLAGYNLLRRKELAIKNLASGLTGFSYGLQLNLNRMNFNYARAHYQSSLTQNQLTIAVRLLSPQK